MLQFDRRQSNSPQNNAQEALLQLLLFVDDRSSSQENIHKIKTYLKSLQSEYDFKLDIIEINKQPHLVEHLKLVATPALVKIHPAPKQTLAGTSIIDQLQKWWPKWQEAIAELSGATDNNNVVENNSNTSSDSIGYSAEIIELSDEIFRLQQEKEELAAQLRFKDQIMAMLAHDLRTPLTAASMAIETIELSEQQKPDNPAKIIQLKEQLFKQAKRQFGIMNSMIEELLQSSQRMSAKLNVEPKQLFLQPLCAEIATQFSKRSKQKSLILKQDIPQDVPAVYGDEELIRQLITNLVDNAIKYTPPGGTISLAIIHRTSQKVQISVCDNGPGIPPENQERIFEGHFRLQRDRHSEGYGLGLAMCRKIVSAHYGQIWVDSSVNKGSCFHITLPVYR